MREDTELTPSSQQTPGLTGQNSEAWDGRTLGVSVHVCASVCVCLHRRGRGGTGWGGFSPFLFLDSSFVTFC